MVFQTIFSTGRVQKGKLLFFNSHIKRLKEHSLKFFKKKAPLELTQRIQSFLKCLSGDGRLKVSLNSEGKISFNFHQALLPTTAISAFSIPGRLHPGNNLAKGEKYFLFEKAKAIAHANNCDDFLFFHRNNAAEFSYGSFLAKREKQFYIGCRSAFWSIALKETLKIITGTTVKLSFINQQSIEEAECIWHLNAFHLIREVNRLEFPNKEILYQPHSLTESIRNQLLRT